MTKQSLIVKITRPRMSLVIPRPRLFQLLDQNGRQSPIIWVSGPAGSGKTSLIASYLDARNLPCLWYSLDEGDSDIATFYYYLSRAAKELAPLEQAPLPSFTVEHLRGVPIFAKRYFESLCSRLKPPTVIVFDNYHHLETGTIFHDMISEALSAIPEGITVVINSRGLPPPSLARLSIYNKIRFLGWEDLKFDEHETKALIGESQEKGPNDDLLSQLRRLTTGWAAGLVLLLKRLRTRGMTPQELDNVKPDEFFDYFATELFEKTDGETQAILLKTSFLPRITPQAAVELTDNEHAGTLLADLSRNHFFTELRSAPDPVYQYHPLFREFLQARARRTYSALEIRVIMHIAAALLDEAGQFEDAAGLYRLAEDWERLVALIKTHAHPMISQGRGRTLEAWLSGLPADILSGDPWLLYWMGICRTSLQLLDGRNYFKTSFALFRKQRNPAGIFLSWCGVIESIVQGKNGLRQLARWLPLIDELLREYDFPSSRIEAQVTAWTFVISQFEKHEDPVFAVRKGKTAALLDSDADACLRLNLGWHLLFYHAWKGEFSAGQHILSGIRLLLRRTPELSPLTALWGMVSEGFLELQTGSFDQVRSTLSAVLTKSEESGIHLWDTVMMSLGAQASLYSGDLAGAGRLLDQMADGMKGAGFLDRFSYFYASSLRYYFTNELPRAIAHQESALALAPKTGIPFFEAMSNFGMAQLMRARGDRLQAKEHNARCLAIGRKLGSSILDFMCLLTESALAFDEKNDIQGLAYLNDALSLGREKGFFYFAWRHPSSLILPLCVKALEAGIETGYVTELIRTCNCAPDEPPVHIESWPWAIQIYTLGRFELLKDGEPLIFSGKMQKKPLDLLKALISFGGQEVSEELVINALWPDADGDMARISFRTTLHRLRQLMGREEIIQGKKGRMSLDQRYCWVDVWAFERMIGDLENGIKRDRESVRSGKPFPFPLPRFAGKAVALYRGHFLDHDENKSWSLSLRERLRSKHVFLVTALGDHWMRRYETIRHAPSPSPDAQSSMEQAIECYRRGLEIDDVVEEFYQKLMICHQRLDNNAEAVKVYQRCRSALTSTLGVEPSEKTERLYCRIRAEKDPSDGTPMYYI